MRILVINPNWNAYSEVWLHRMMGYLKNEIVGVACFSPGAKFWDNGAPSFDLYGQKLGLLKKIYNKVPFSKKIQQKSVENDFEKFVEKLKPTLIFINFTGPAIFLKRVIEKIEIPVVIHTHGGDINADAYNHEGLRAHADRFALDVSLLGKMKHVYFIANSNYARTLLSKFELDEKKIIQKYFGVESKKVVRQFNKNLKVLYLGRFVDFKGPDLVVQSFIKACDQGFNGTLKMVGSGPLLIACKLLAKRSKYADKISFKEPVDANTAAKLFAESDIYTMHNCLGILTGEGEAFGVTIIEAMSFGTVVITGNYGGPQEIIENREDGILITPEDVEAHAQALLDLQNNPDLLQKLSRNAILKVDKLFSAAQERAKLFSIFKKIENRVELS